MLGWRDSFKLAGKQFSYGISASLSDYTAKYTKCDNPTGLIGDPYVGKRLGEIWGYKVGGLFRTDEEAAEYASRIDYRTVAPGYYSFWGPYSRPYATFIPRDFMSKVWSEENPNAYFPRARAYSSLNSTSGVVYYTNDRYIQNLAYCRLKNLTVGYTIPTHLTSKIGIKELRIYFSGENLATWTALKSKFLDPEQAAADSDKKANVYPWCKTYSIGLNLTF